MGRKKKEPEVKLPAIKQLPSGAWNTRIYIDGHTVSITKPSYDECAAEYLAMKHGVIEAKEPEERKVKPLEQAVAEYINSIRGYRSPSTIYGYEKDARNTFQQAMKWNVYTTSNAQWQKAISDERKKGRSAKYIKNAWMLMAASIEMATKKRPVVNLYPPEAEARAWLDPDEIDKLVETIKGKPHEIPILLCLSSLRRSEMLGLKWSQVDLKKKIITISGATVRGTDGLVDKVQNKTKKSKRTIPIIPPLLDALQAAERKSEKVVTCSGDTVLKYVHIYCHQCEITDVDLHGLRHSFASLCYHLEIPEMICAEIGGWDDLGTMHKIYTHLGQKDIDRRSKQFSDYFAKDKKSAD